MSCFTKNEVKNPKFPNLSAEVTRLKTTEGGASAVCEVMREYEQKAAFKAQIDTLISLVKKGLLQIADAAKEAGITEDAFKEQMTKAAS